MLKKFTAQIVGVLSKMCCDITFALGAHKSEKVQESTSGTKIRVDRVHVRHFWDWKAKFYVDTNAFFEISRKQSSAENKLEKLTENPGTVQTLV